jgi:hypothetical protein
LSEAEWLALIAERQDVTPDLTLVTPLAQDLGGGSGSFRALASDGKHYFVKPPNQLQGGRVLTTEHVVAGVGRLIGAATCKSEIIVIPKEIADLAWEFRPGSTLGQGLGHASEAVPDATEARGAPGRRGDDDNKRRHAGLAAVYDLCWGADDQYLHSTTDEWRIYSHDHGHYLPGGPTWTADLLRSHVNLDHEVGFDFLGLNAGDLEEAAIAVERLDRDSLATVLCAVPRSWSTPDEDLAALGHFIETRVAPVAARLRARKGTAS